MILDLQNTLSDQQTVAIAAATPTLSTNSIDFGAPGSNARGTTLTPNHGIGAKPELVVQVTQTVTSGGAGTLMVEVVVGTGVDGNGQINAGLRVLQQSAAIAKATLVAGYQFSVGMVPSFTERYLAVRYNVGTADLTAGKVTAGLVFDRKHDL